MALEELRDFDFESSAVTLWTFKGTAPKVNGHWIETSDSLDGHLKSVATSQLSQLEEEFEYGLLTQNNEASVLILPQDETYFYAVLEGLSDASYSRKIRDVRTIRNAKFYVAEFVCDDKVVHAVKRTDKSWRTQEKKAIINIFWKDKQLDVLDDDGFTIHRSFDFFVYDNNLLISNKSNFETILNYRAFHQQDFEDLCGEAEFLGIFVDVAPLIAFVGTNKAQLRRMSAIRQKGFYKDADFMSRLRGQYSDFGLSLDFNSNGMIEASAGNCKDVLTALLDHRLRSSFSQITYDVQSTSTI